MDNQNLYLLITTMKRYSITEDYVGYLLSLESTDCVILYLFL